MNKMNEPFKTRKVAEGTWVIEDRPLKMGETLASFPAVYEYKNGTWFCEKCKRNEGSSLGHCDHIASIKQAD